MAGAFDGHGQDSLMVCASTGDASWEDFASVGDESPEFAGVFVVDPLCLFEAEMADFASWETASSRCSSSGASCAAVASIASVCARAAIAAVSSIGAIAVGPALSGVSAGTAWSSPLARIGAGRSRLFPGGFGSFGSGRPLGFGGAFLFFGLFCFRCISHLACNLSFSRVGVTWDRI